MNTARTILGAILCIVGFLFVVFELGMLASEPGAFVHGGWVPFLVFVVIGLILLAGGALLVLDGRRGRY